MREDISGHAPHHQPKYERITAGDIRVGDKVARSRTHTFERVVRISEGSRLSSGRGGERLSLAMIRGEYRKVPPLAEYTIARPRKTAKWWREV